MAESTLSLDFSDLQEAVGHFLGHGVDSTAWSALQAAEIDRYVHAGVRRVYFPSAAEGVEAGYEWSFLNPTTTIATTADDAAQVLPDDFGRMLGDFYFAPSVHTKSIPIIAQGQLLAMLQQSTTTGRPQFAAIRFTTSDGTTGQRQEVAWWPIPDAAYTLTYHYEAFSGKLSGTKYPLGGMKFSELYVESCLAVAEQRANDERGLHWEEFVRLLVAAIAEDRRNGARVFGRMGEPDQVVLPRHMTAGSYEITYKGTTW